jgi:hypothetical protein
MRSIIDILLDDNDASIALSLCIAGDVARSTDATSEESSGELTTASTRLPTRGSKSFAQGTAAAGGVALPPRGGSTRAGGGVARTGDRGGDLRSISGASAGATTTGGDG